MYNFLMALFILGMVLLLVGFIGRLGTGAAHEIDSNIAASFGLIFIYAFLLTRGGSFSGVKEFFSQISGSVIGFADSNLDVLADYDSFIEALRQNPETVVKAFLDFVMLSTVNELATSRYNLHDSAMMKSYPMAMLLKLVFVPIAIYFLFLFAKSKINPYLWYGISGAVVLLTVFSSLPIGFLGRAGRPLSRSALAGKLKSACLKAVVCLAMVWFMERHCGELSGAISLLSNLAVAFIPVFIILLGIHYICKGANLRK